MRYFLSCILIFSAFLAQGQRSLSLMDCLELARTKSPLADQARLAFQAQAYDYEAFQKSFFPQLSLSADLPGLSRSIDNILQDDGSIRFVPQSQTFSTVSLNLRQQIPLTGGTVFAYSSLFNRLDLDNTDNVLWQTSPFVVGLRQPLFQLNRQKWDRMQESLSFRLAKLNYNETIEQTASQVLDIYFEALLAQMNLAIADQNVANNDTIFKISQGRFEVGKIAENELLQSELTYLNAQTDQASARIAYEQAVRRLKVALGIPQGEDIGLANPDLIPRIRVSPEQAVAEALRYSSQLQEAEFSRLLASREVALAKQDQRPTADLNATFGLNSSDVNLNQAYQNLVDRQSFSIGLDMPILQWGQAKDRLMAAQAREEQTRISLEQQRRNFENEIRFQVLNIQLLAQQIDRATRGDTIAQRRYLVTKNRYQLGKVDIQALFIAQNEKDQARRSYLSTLRSYWRALTNLRVATLYDFVEGKPIAWRVEGR
jgi:outer membrane protein TolC